MATDAASLLIKVDSTQAGKAAADLDKLTAAGARTEQQVTRMTAKQYQAVQGIEAFARATSRLPAASNTASAAAARMAAQATGMGRAAGLARHHLQNLSFQVNDVAMALSTGQDPMRVFIQQGSQIAQIGSQAGVGVGGLARAVLGLLAPFAGVIAGAGLLAAALGRVKAEADAGLDPFIQSLGLTKDEIAELTDTTVTWGDVMGATFEVMAEAGGTSADEVQGAWETALETIGEFAQFSVGVIAGAFGALVQFVGSTAQNIGVLIAKGIEWGVNKALEFIETLINGVASGLNKVAGFLSAMGVNVGSVGTVKLGRVAATGSFTSPFGDARNRFFDTFDAVQGGFAAIGARADRRRRSRLRDQADELIGDRDGAGGGRGGRGRRAAAHRDVARALNEEERAYQQALKAAQSYLAGLQSETERIGKTAIEIKRIEVNAAAAKAPTIELAQAIREAGTAWEAATKAQAITDFAKNIIEPLEFENSLIGASVEAQRLLRAERELTAAGIARGTAEWERYIAAVQLAAANDNQISSQQNILRYVDSLSAAITDVIMGAQSLGEAFSNVARSIIADIIQMTIRMLIFRAISGIFGGGGGLSGVAAFNATAAAPGFAAGGVFAHGNVVPFASGGIVNSPLLFPMRGGRTGIMGEAGPEAIMPLARDSRGRLGVRANDNQSGPIEVRVVVDASEDLMVKAAVVADSRIAAAEPRIVRNSASATLRAAKRPVLMGRR